MKCWQGDIRWEVPIITVPGLACLCAPLVWKFLMDLFYSFWYYWLGLAPEFVLKLLAAPRFSTSCLFWKYEVKKKKTFILHLPHSISECQSGNEASTRPSAIKATTNRSMLLSGSGIDHQSQLCIFGESPNGVVPLVQIFWAFITIAKYPCDTDIHTDQLENTVHPDDDQTELRIQHLGLTTSRAWHRHWYPLAGISYLTKSHPCMSSYKPSSTTLDHPGLSCKTTHTTQPAPSVSRNCSDLWSPDLLPPFVVTAPGRVSPMSDISISLPPNLSFLNISSGGDGQNYMMRILCKMSMYLPSSMWTMISKKSYWLGGTSPPLTNPKCFHQKGLKAICQLKRRNKWRGFRDLWIILCTLGMAPYFSSLLKYGFERKY